MLLWLNKTFDKTGSADSVHSKKKINMCLRKLFMLDLAFMHPAAIWQDFHTRTLNVFQLISCFWGSRVSRLRCFCLGFRDLVLMSLIWALKTIDFDFYWMATVFVNTRFAYLRIWGFWISAFRVSIKNLHSTGKVDLIKNAKKHTFHKCEWHQETAMRKIQANNLIVFHQTDHHAIINDGNHSLSSS